MMQISHLRQAVPKCVNDYYEVEYHERRLLKGVYSAFPLYLKEQIQTSEWLGLWLGGEQNNFFMQIFFPIRNTGEAGAFTVESLRNISK